MDDFSSGYRKRDAMRVLLAQAHRTREVLDRIVDVVAPMRGSETHAHHPFCDDSCGECMAQEA
jgi:hypothetical protein